MTGIEWTDATWNPTTGCSKVSPGRAHCYAETLSLRYGWSKKPWTPENAAENVVLHPERLGKPLSWRKPRMVFVNSMSDLFHELVPRDFIHSVFETMEKAERHTFQVLTKRPERAVEILTWLYTCSWCDGHGFLAGAHTDGVNECPMCKGTGEKDPLPNVWIGVSIENDGHAYRADFLAQMPAAVRFVSAEPLLGPLPSLSLSHVDWLIVGGESGNGHRPIEENWVRLLRDRATASGTAFFFKQWGGRTPKAGGRELDGRLWDEMPGGAA